MAPLFVILSEAKDLRGRSFASLRMTNKDSTDDVFTDAGARCRPSSNSRRGVDWDGRGSGCEGRLKSAAAVLVIALLLLAFATNALAHGERAQEPSLRLSTIQWYDTKWSSDQIGVNQEFTLSGRFHVMANWPLEIPSPAGLAFLNVGVPGPVFIRTASVVNGVNGASSMSLALGQDYEYRIVLRGRIPGRYHVHPMLDVRDTGPILGPGKWVSITGDAAAFTDPVTTLTGRRLDLARYGLGAIAGWHLVWVAIALLWLGYWIRKPLLMPRYEAVQAGNGDRLITRTDRIAAAVVLALTLIVAIGETVVTSLATRLRYRCSPIRPNCLCLRCCPPKSRSYPNK